MTLIVLFHWQFLPKSYQTISALINSIQDIYKGRYTGKRAHDAA